MQKHFTPDQPGVSTSRRFPPACGLWFLLLLLLVALAAFGWRLLGKWPQGGFDYSNAYAMSKTKTQPQLNTSAASDSPPAKNGRLGPLLG